METTNIIKAVEILLTQLENEHLSEFSDEPIEVIKSILERVKNNISPIPIHIINADHVKVSFDSEKILIEGMK